MAEIRPHRRERIEQWLARATQLAVAVQEQRNVRVPHERGAPPRLLVGRDPAERLAKHEVAGLTVLAAQPLVAPEGEYERGDHEEREKHDGEPRPIARAPPAHAHAQPLEHPAVRQRRDHPECEEQHEIEHHRQRTALQQNPERAELDLDAVSYTHLRAHETDSYLVCRLLLEKK